jgi:16S rRNA processing protein RimM
MSKFIVVGEVRGVHGLKGFFKITSFTENPDNIFKFKSFNIGKNYRSINLKKIKALPNGYIVSCKEVDSREKSELIVGSLIEIESSELPDINDRKKYYFHELISLEVKDENEKSLGTVCSVENYGSADLIEVRNKEQKDFFIPFSKMTIKKVDLEKKLLLVQNVSEYLN